MNEKIISIHNICNYDIPLKYLFERLSLKEVKDFSTITNDIIEIGNRYSPDFVSLEFKYNLGCFINALNEGSNILINISNEYESKYYTEVQKQILTNLGYKFEIYNLFDNNIPRIKSIYKVLKKINPKMNLLTYLYNYFIYYIMMIYVDKINIYVSKNIGFEINKGNFDRLNNSMAKKFLHTKGIIDLSNLYRKYIARFKSIALDKPKKCIKVGLINENYPFINQKSDYYIEKEFANMNIEINRFYSIPIFNKLYIKKIKNYKKYLVNSYFLDNIIKAKKLIDDGCVAIIHIKPFKNISNNIDDIILKNLCNNENVILMDLNSNFDFSDVAIHTRLEALYDMININKNS